MRHRIPILVLPLQLEQAQNGLCVERMGCGHRLLHGVIFTGDPANTEEAFLARPVTRLAEDVLSFLAENRPLNRMVHASEQIGRYQGATALARQSENP